MVRRRSSLPVELKVMWHRYSMSGLAAAQYLSYLLVGAFYFVVFRAMARVAGVSIVGLGAVLVPLVLGGYLSALSFILPRVAAVMAFTCAVPYLILGLAGLRITAQMTSVFVIPSAVVIGVSIVALLWSDGSVWRRLTRRFDKIAIGILGMLPLLFATWWLGSFLFGLLSSYLHRVT